MAELSAELKKSLGCNLDDSDDDGAGDGGESSQQLVMPSRPKKKRNAPAQVQRTRPLMHASSSCAASCADPIALVSTASGVRSEACRGDKQEEAEAPREAEEST